MRKKIIAGNWKMNKTSAETIAFLNEIKSSVDSKSVEVVFCVPFTSIVNAIEVVKNTNIEIGAQNMHFEENGAFTGEISAEMLLDLGVKYVVVGHSERREYFAETDEIVNKKTIQALAKGLIPIVCIGEKLADRELGITIELVRLQAKCAFNNISKEDAKKVVVAYEPIWAIGTGKTATTQQAEEVCAAIRDVICEIYDESVAETVRIQYGGSVSPDNAKELFSMPNIDGGLVGGSSLKSDFGKIINA